MRRRAVLFGLTLVAAVMRRDGRPAPGPGIGSVPTSTAAIRGCQAAPVCAGMGDPWCGRQEGFAGLEPHGGAFAVGQSDIPLHRGSHARARCLAPLLHRAGRLGLAVLAGARGLNRV